MGTMAARRWTLYAIAFTVTSLVAGTGEHLTPDEHSQDAA